MSDLVGTTLGKYQILELLGQGGMAEVYRAFQPGLDRVVAIKVVHGFLSRDENFLGRFRREAQAVADLRHPNIVQVYDFDIHEGRPYMVLEFIDGVTLGNVIDLRIGQLQTLEMTEVLWIMQSLCSAVSYAHKQGIVHRDITPANVMLTTDKRVILTDFGLVRILGGMKFTATGQITGTPEYMSPEQAHGAAGDQRSDIYALGILLYETLTGNTPYQGETPVSVLLKHVSHPIPLVREIKPEIPQRLEAVISKVLAKDPDERYQTADEYWNAIQAACPEQSAPPQELWKGKIEQADEKRKTTIKKMNPVEVPSAPPTPAAAVGTAASSPNQPLFSIEQVGHIASQILVGIEARKETTASGAVRTVTVSQSGPTVTDANGERSLIKNFRTSILLGAVAAAIGTCFILACSVLFRMWTGEAPLIFGSSLANGTGIFDPAAFSMQTVLARSFVYYFLIVILGSLPGLVMGAFFRSLSRAFDMFFNVLGYLFVSGLIILCYNAFIAYQAIDIPSVQFMLASRASIRQISSIAALSPVITVVQPEKLNGELKQKLLLAKEENALTSELVTSAVRTCLHTKLTTNSYVGSWTLGYMIVLGMSLASYLTSSRKQVLIFSFAFLAILTGLLLQSQSLVALNGEASQVNLAIAVLEVPNGAKLMMEVTWGLLLLVAFFSALLARSSKHSPASSGSRGQSMSIHLQP